MRKEVAYDTFLFQSYFLKYEDNDEMIQSKMLKEEL